MSRISDLEHNPRNPRKITDRKLAMLRKAIERFGDLGGVVYNRRTKRLVGGHQRTRIFTPETPVEIEKTYDAPTRTGTRAEGFILWKGEKHRYREVDWDEATETAANLAANKGAGEFDMAAVEAMIGELEAASFDLDLSMFEADELTALAQNSTAGMLPIAPEDTEESRSGTADRFLAFGRVRVPLTDEEEIALTKAVDAYKNEFGMLYGFISHLMDLKQGHR